jgi:membrane protein required for colicin V production
MNLIDLIITIILIIAFVRGYKNGLIKEIMSLISVFVGLFIALYFSDFVKRILIEKFQYQSNFIDIVSFIITFLIAFYVLKLLTNITDKLADMVFLGWLNNLLGGVFSSLKSILILSFLVIFFEKININNLFVKQEKLNEIKWFQPIKNINNMVFPLINSWIKNYENNENNENTNQK